MSLKKISTWELCQHSLNLNTKYPPRWLKGGLKVFYELWWISSYAPLKDSLFFYEWNFIGDLELESSIFKGLEFLKGLVVSMLNSSRTLRLVRMIWMNILRIFFAFEGFDVEITWGFKAWILWIFDEIKFLKFFGGFKA